MHDLSPLPGMHRDHNALPSQTDGQTDTDIVAYILHLALKTEQRNVQCCKCERIYLGHSSTKASDVLVVGHSGEKSADCVIVSDGSSAAILPLLGNITAAAAAAAGDGRQGVAIFGRCGGARASQLLTSDTWRTETTLFISSDGADCGRHLANIGRLSSAFARWRIGTVHVVVERADLRSRDLGAWLRDAGALLRRYAATLDAVVKHDVTTRVFVHVDVIVTSRGRDAKSLCRDPFASVSRDFADVILSTVYSFTDVYRSVYKLKHVYNVLYVLQKFS